MKKFIGMLVYAGEYRERERERERERKRAVPMECIEIVGNSLKNSVNFFSKIKKIG